MKFRINQIKLWFKNDSESRVLNFKNNKVNVITGGSGTGKSSILSIIDYCLLSTNARIPETAINENILWYGINFNINDKNFSIIRKQPKNNIGSKEIYFSGTGIMPDFPIQNNDITQVKTVIEKEFGIDEKFRMPYGGKHIAAGSKISYRYFLLFNTLSEDTISHTNTFFDYDLYDRDKYVEALERIFYLAIGVDDVGNVLAREKLENLEKELIKIEKRKKAVDKEELLFGKNIQDLIIKAQEYDLIERKLFTSDEGQQRLKSLIHNFGAPVVYSNNIQQVDELNKQKRSLWRKIRNLERFNNEYQQYKINLKKDYESLKPINYLTENFGDLIPTLELKTFLQSLTDSLQQIKIEISKKVSLASNVKSEIDELKKQIDFLDQELGRYPTTENDFANGIQKYIFIGEIKAQLKFYEDKWNTDEDIYFTSEIEEDIALLRETIQDNNEKRRIMLSDLETVIQSYYNSSKSMGVYGDFKVYFDLKGKTLKVRKPNEQVSFTIGSKSNYMFLHLFLFLGLHEHFISQKIGFVPQFLFLDQPSQPYYEGNADKDKKDLEDDDDKIKLQDAFKLLNDFIERVNNELGQDFQIILLEHAPKDYWEELNLQNFHLVEEFREGNALIPKDAISN